MVAATPVFTTVEELQEAAYNGIRNSTKCDPTYRSKWNAYTKWVDAERAAGRLVAGAYYLTRENVDRYFLAVVVDMTAGKASVRKEVSALQWFANNREHVGADRFVVENAIVLICLKTQIANRSKTLEEKGNGSDPHKGLKDVLPEFEREILMRHVYSNRNDWGPLSVSFTWGQNVALRGASTRKLVYADLNLSYGFGPEKEGPRARIPLLVLRRGDVHKDNHVTDKQVGCWRHRNYLLCSVSALARHVLWDLKNNATINFLHADRDKQAGWWDTCLVDWETYSQQSGPVKQVFDETNVVSCKVTHDRTLAVQHAGSEGLAPYQISTMTKHMLEKLHSAYMAEVDKEVCKVMAGFSKEEPYFVPRTMLTLLHPIEVYERLLLPDLADWRVEAASVGGDKSSCCDKFLNHVVPFLVEVLIQDSIYFVRDFPEHEISQWLCVSTPNTVDYFFIECLTR
jgi:hypothetical protein